MGANSEIQWTDHTFNPWRGCSKVHAGCTNCYAENNMSVKLHGIKWGPNGTRVMASDAMWREPLKWNREAVKAGERRRVFCASLADVFEDWQGRVLDHRGHPLCVNDSREVYAEGIPCELPDGDDWGQRELTLDDLRKRLFYVIDKTPNLDWLLLTKRPENIKRMWPAVDDIQPIFPGAPGNLGKSIPCKVPLGCRHNVWLGTSVSDQATADKMIPELLKCRELCRVLFLSAEPLLGPINLQPHLTQRGEFVNAQGINCDWVIVGGESGNGARPCNVAWIRSIVDQCKAAGVPVFVKQMGSNVQCPTAEREQWMTDGRATRLHTIGDTTLLSLRAKKGGDMAEWPADLRVREFPAVTTAV